MIQLSTQDQLGWRRLGSALKDQALHSLGPRLSILFEQRVDKSSSAIDNYTPIQRGTGVLVDRY
jgi:hypothetical protein